MIAQEFINDLSDEYAKAVIEPLFKRVMLLMLTNKPIPVALVECANLDVFHRLAWPQDRLPFNPQRASDKPH